MPQFDFISAVVSDLVAHTPLAGLSDADKKIYLPEIERVVRERLGLELLPKLSKDSLAVLSENLSKENLQAEDWKKFWEDSVPNFSVEVKKILQRLSDEIIKTLTVSAV